MSFLACCAQRSMSSSFLAGEEHDDDEEEEEEEEEDGTGRGTVLHGMVLPPFFMLDAASSITVASTMGPCTFVAINNHAHLPSSFHC